MAETKTEVTTYRIDYACDECGKGFMRSNGITLTSLPPQYDHACTECGATKRFSDVTYPHTITE